MRYNSNLFHNPEVIEGLFRADIQNRFYWTEVRELAFSKAPDGTRKRENKIG